MNGTADATMPFTGGRVGGPPGLDFGAVASTARTAERWRGWNGCRGEPQRFALPDRDPADGTRMRLEAWRDCRAGAEVLVYVVEGGGHQLPSRTPGPPARNPAAGLASRDADGAALIWAFLRRHQR